MPVLSEQNQRKTSRAADSAAELNKLTLSDPRHYRPFEMATAKQATVQGAMDSWVGGKTYRFVTTCLSRPIPTVEAPRRARDKSKLPNHFLTATCLFFPSLQSITTEGASCCAAPCLHCVFFVFGPSSSWDHVRGVRCYMGLYGAIILQ